MKSKILKDKTKKMLETVNLPYTHRPYVDFDSYVLTYEETIKKPHEAIFGNFGTGKESMIYAMHKNMEKINSSNNWKYCIPFLGSGKGCEKQMRAIYSVEWGNI